MLTTEENARLADASVAAIRELEDALLVEMAREMGSLQSFDQQDVNRALMKLSPRFQALAKKHLPQVLDAIRRDLTGAFTVSAIREFNHLKRALDGRIGAFSPVSVAARSAEPAIADAQLVASAMVGGMSAQAGNTFLNACDTARVSANLIGERAMAKGVQQMAREGITAYIVKRSDGTFAKIPADVAVRRSVVNAGKRRMGDQTIEIAKLSEHALVEVSETANCRDSHEEWQGGIYSLNGEVEVDGVLYRDFYEACNYGDMETGIFGYNCGHMIATYTVGFPKQFKDPLEGTGYTTDEVRKLTSTQRGYENTIRKQKREVECLKAAGLDTHDANVRLNATRANLRTLIDEHDTVLRRERHREQIYDSAARMAREYERA